MDAEEEFEIFNEPSGSFINLKFPVDIQDQVNNLSQPMKVNIDGIREDNKFKSSEKRLNFAEKEISPQKIVNIVKIGKLSEIYNKKKQLHSSLLQNIDILENKIISIGLVDKFTAEDLVFII